MKATVFLSLILFLSSLSLAVPSNYNSILIGDRAAGMGGAFTALSEDPAGCAYYNPASLSWMKGTSLSASVSLFTKFDSIYSGDETTGLEKAAFRANQGAFKQVPSSLGYFAGMGPFALGFSILTPHYLVYKGDVKTSDNSQTRLQLHETSMWAGGAFAINISSSESLGLSAYYTSVDFNRTTTQETRTNTTASVTNEEKIITNNSLIYILGYRKKISDSWYLGISYRFPSLEISGNGKYFQSSVSSNSAPTPLISKDKLKSEYREVTKLALGIAYQGIEDLTLSFDVHHYGTEIYWDLDDDSVGQKIHSKSITNVSLGAEYLIKPWMRLRLGGFTNLSAHPAIPESPDSLYGDSLYMWGFSGNLAIYTQSQVSFTFGGYYTGGNGYSTHPFEGQIHKIAKEDQIFSMLIGTAYLF